ncbi:two-component system, chemotaxis family, response regulator CheY [Fodinibius roseus]|uniref:Two-component system, chemotaxis family, response regulator CheY n=1 Tax=Fodinibius roseus TaxID=1194090 RepID=A0A1M5HHI0_9BACT|nr:response regulator [Fodinibius roseus]SHG15381.1 two-component system, chemotaxis family, response regulator CheY [Fodinibius roseus]
MAINILVVDDSAVMRKMIIKTIRLCGLDVNQIYEAENGREGLLVLDRGEVDFLFIDINMPVMDGMEMLSRVRQQEATKKLPVLIVSTESNKGRIEEIDRQGAGFVHKPFTPENLRKKMLDITS